MPTLPPLPFALADGPAEGFNLLSIWHEVSLFNRGIIILLLLLLLLQIYIAVERGVLYLQSAAATRRFLPVFLEALRLGDFEAAGRAAADHGRSHLAQAFADADSHHLFAGVAEVAVADYIPEPELQRIDAEFQHHHEKNRKKYEASHSVSRG